MAQSFNNIRGSVDAATRDMGERCFVFGSLVLNPKLRWTQKHLNGFKSV
jgi:hypothetical protein